MTAPWVHPKTGGFYYRKVIPPRARHLFGGKVEVRRSLGTREPGQARLRYAEIAHEVEAQDRRRQRPAVRRQPRSLLALAGERYRRKRDECGPEPRLRRDRARSPRISTRR